MQEDHNLLALKPSSFKKSPYIFQNTNFLKCFSTNRCHFLYNYRSSSLNIVGIKLREGRRISHYLEFLQGLLSGLKSGHVARADGEIVDAAGLDRLPPVLLLGRLLWPQLRGAKQLRQLPGLNI